MSGCLLFKNNSDEGQPVLADYQQYNQLLKYEYSADKCVAQEECHIDKAGCEQ